ncbi:MAG: hypothetical protein RJA99_991 [Pseudomonadota bacterium]|jgi:Tol biopolymer transport system component
MRTHPLFLRLAAGVMLTLSLASAHAACVANPPAQPDNTFPVTLTGRLVYHSYATYGDGTSQLFIHDFSARRLTQVSNASWGIRDPMNAVFSPDGNWLAFMGFTNRTWNVFLWRVGTAALPVNLTNSTGQTRNEDPKFSADGKSLFFKRDGNIVQGTLSYTSAGPVFTSVVPLASKGPGGENSMPYPAPDGTAFYFTTGADSTIKVQRQVVGSPDVVAFDPRTDLASYYPVVRADGTVFYVRWRDGISKYDQIHMKRNPGDASSALPFNDCNSNNSDPWPVSGTDYVFFSSTSAGRYQLYLGDAVTGRRWSLSQFGVNSDTTKDKLGASYHPSPSCGLLASGASLPAGGSKTSCDGRFTFVIQTDGNLVLYKAGVGAIWANYIFGAGHTLTMQGDGNLVVYNGASQARWHAITWGYPGAWLAVQDDGNVVVYSAKNEPLWDTGTWWRR